MRLLIFLLEILIAVCASSSPAFHTMYSAYKFNKQGDDIKPWCTPLSIWNQSIVPCLVLIVASWPAYRCLRGQVRWPRIPISKNFPVCWDPHKGFSVVKKQRSEPDMEQWTGSKLGKEYVKTASCHPAYSYMKSTSYKMTGWMKHKLESRFPGEISITSDMQIIPA